MADQNIKQQERQNKNRWLGCKSNIGGSPEIYWGVHLLPLDSKLQKWKTE